MADPFHIAWSLASISCCALAVSLLVHRLRASGADRGLQPVLIDNYRNWVEGLKQVIERRGLHLKDLASSLESLGDEASDLVIGCFEQSQQRLHAALRDQLRGDQRSLLRVEPVLREFLAQDQVILDLINHLTAQSPAESPSSDREVIDQIRGKIAEVERDAIAVGAALENDRVELESRMAGMVPARALEDALTELEATERDLEALERAVLDREGQIRQSFTEEEIATHGRRCRALSEEIARAMAGHHGAGSERGPLGQGHRLRLKRIEHGLLRRLIETHSLIQGGEDLANEVKRHAPPSL